MALLMPHRVTDRRSHPHTVYVPARETDGGMERERESGLMKGASRQ